MVSNSFQSPGKQKPNKIKQKPIYDQPKLKTKEKSDAKVQEELKLIIR